MIVQGSEPIKVLYIAGDNRSGSTLLGRILGENDGFFYAGQLQTIWQARRKNWRCSSGLRFADSPFWQAVFERAYGGFDGIDPMRMRQLQHRSSLMGSLRNVFRGRAILQTAPDYRAALESLYEAVQSVSNCRVIVDSSKSPSYAYHLLRLASVELYVVQLVRDARAVAFSNMRCKPTAYDQQALPRHGPAWSGARWMAVHSITEILLRRAKKMRLRYEHFTVQPPTHAKTIVQFCKETPTEVPFVGCHEINLRAGEDFDGNPMRWDRGPVRVKEDDEWRSRMRRRDRALTTAIAAPLMLRYGYL